MPTAHSIPLGNCSVWASRFWQDWPHRAWSTSSSIGMQESTLNPASQQPKESGSKAILRSHWVGFLSLVPSLVLLAIHRLLGLSDALMAQTPPREQEAHTYNLIMICVFYAGVVGFTAHTFAFARGNQSQLAAKLLALAAYWILFVMFA